jgi:glutathione S-transferase
MKLMYAPQSPFARKVRVAAIELGLGGRIELEYAEVVPGRKNAAYGDGINPLRKVPALITDDGTVLVDSTVICEYLDALAGGGRLVPPSGPERWRVLAAHAVAQGMTDALILVRYETWLRPEPLRWADWTDDQWDKLWTGARWFNEQVATFGKDPDLAQIGLACCFGYVEFRYADSGWRRRFPELAIWYDGISRRPSFIATVPRNPG